jgi:phospholipid/cholesterol/gamma-HCH transport system substrate-binding protein
MLTAMAAVLRTLRTWLIVGAAGGLAFLGVKNAYGGFEERYALTVDLPVAGQQMQVGSDVRLRGVKIGEVSAVDLVDRRARLTLLIEDEYRVPAGATAVVSLKTLLGAKFVDLRTDALSGPWLADGDALARSRVGPELEDALDDGVSVLEAIDPDQLAGVIGELATAARGHGDDVARSLRANAELSGLFARTLRPQLQSLEDFETIFGALEDAAVDLNLLAQAINEGVPVYASERAQRHLRRALEAVAPFSRDLGDLLTLDRAAWDRMIERGDVVLGTMAARPEGLRDLVTGLFNYVHDLGGPAYPVGNGSGAAGFVNFIGGNDEEEERAQICSAFPLDIRGHVPMCSGAI